jgi:hypothetical protein
MTPPETTAARRRLQRRIKRGIVMSYLHGLSRRHRPKPEPPVPPAEPATARATT